MCHANNIYRKNKVFNNVKKKVAIGTRHSKEGNKWRRAVHFIKTGEQIGNICDVTIRVEK